MEDFQISLVEQTELVCYTWVEKIFEKCYVIIDYCIDIILSYHHMYIHDYIYIYSTHEP